MTWIVVERKTKGKIKAKDKEKGEERKSLGTAKALMAGSIYICDRGDNAA